MRDAVKRRLIPLTRSVLATKVPFDDLDIDRQQVLFNIVFPDKDLSVEKDDAIISVVRHIYYMSVSAHSTVIVCL